MSSVKLDSRLITSSAAHLDPKTFKTFILILAGTDERGISSVTVPYLCSCGLSNDDVKHAIKILSSPDPYSRSKNDDGRRIAVVDGGYKVINYHVYRKYGARELKKRMSRTCPGHSRNVRTFLDKPTSNFCWEDYGICQA